jgi:hypothetical protein
VLSVHFCRALASQFRLLGIGSLLLNDIFAFAHSGEITGRDIVLVSGRKLTRERL